LTTFSYISWHISDALNHSEDEMMMINVEADFLTEINEQSSEKLSSFSFSANVPVQHPTIKKF
jgi:hypothetical protein